MAFVPLVLAPPLNHDVAAVLSFSQRWLAGERLYVDLIDVNPPLVFVLDLAPAALARASGLDAVAALLLCLVGLALGCWVLALRVRDRAREAPVLRAFLDVLPGLFGFACGYDFGQREVLMATMALPYVLAAAGRAEGRRPRARRTSALLAAVGFALKPHFLAIPLLCEALVLAWRWPGVRRALADPVPWLMASVWGAYLASLPLLFPDYLGFVVPLVWSLYLAQGGLDWLSVLLVPRLATVLLLLLPLLAIVVRGPWRRGPALPWLLAAGALGALASAMAQHKGWSYHVVPIEMFACALGGVLAAGWLDRLGGAAPGAVAPQRAAAALAGLFALYAASNGEAPWKQLGYRQDDVAMLTRMLRESAAGARVLVLSPGISPIFPALNYAHVRLALRSMNMWLLEGAYQACPASGRRYREVWEMGRAEFYVYRTVAEDFARAPPAAVLVDTVPGIPWCGGEFDFVAYFSRHPLFAEVWSHYHLATRAGRYRLFTRQD